MQFTRILCLPYSQARLRASCMSPPSKSHRRRARSSLEAADRRDDGDRTILALDHLRHHQRDQQWLATMLLSRILRNWSSEMPACAHNRIRRGVADQRVDLAEHAVGFLDQCLRSSWSRCWRHRERDLLAALSLIALATSSQTCCLREEITTLAPCSAIRSRWRGRYRAKSR